MVGVTTRKRKAAQGQPRIPQLLKVKVGLNRLDRAADCIEVLQRTFVESKQLWIHRKMTLQIAQPADFHTAQIALKGLGKEAGVILTAGEWQSVVKACLHSEQHGEVGNIASHGSGHAELLEKHLLPGAMWHAARRGTKAKDVVKSSRRTQRTHHVRAIRHRQHA